MDGHDEAECIFDSDKDADSLLDINGRCVLETEGLFVLIMLTDTLDVAVWSILVDALPEYVFDTVLVLVLDELLVKLLDTEDVLVL